MKKTVATIIFVILMVVLARIAWTKGSTADQTAGLSIHRPLFLVPGTGGTVDQFDDLVSKLKKRHPAIDVLKITVNTNGSINTSGKIREKTPYPFIVVAFEDASDPALPEQAAWFQQALTYAKKQYRFDSYNYLGYSNGGLVATGYLEKERQASDPKLDTLVTLGSPYNDTDWAYNENSGRFSQPKNTSPLMESYLKDAENIPKNIRMVNIAGNMEKQNTDLVVPLTSVLAGRIFYGKSDAYQEIIVPDADHFTIIENEEVLRVIEKNLLKTGEMK